MKKMENWEWWLSGGVVQLFGGCAGPWLVACATALDVLAGSCSASSNTILTSSLITHRKLPQIVRQ
jgi:hypothetical protein